MFPKHFVLLKASVVIDSSDKHHKEVRVMNKRKLAAFSTALVIVAIVMMVTPAFAEPLYDFNSKTGTYTTVDVGACGNYDYETLHCPAAYVKGIIDTDLPEGYTLKVEYQFQWMDTNFVLHTENGTRYSSLTKAGEWISIEPKDLPLDVYFICAGGRTGYGNTWDTDWAWAGVPWN